jgi:GT2 family glycosyltransferase
VTTPLVDIVVVSHNTRGDLEACLAAVRASPPRAPHRIVVVDNASTDGSADAVEARWPDIRVIRSARNVGFGAANNLAIRESGADLVLLLNSDTIAPPGAVDRLIDRLQQTGAAAAGPRLVDAAGRPEVSFGRKLSPWSELVQRTRTRIARRPGRLARWYVDRLVARERFVDWVSGACLLLRRRAAVDAGLFDERYFMYEEDVDLCVAIGARGGRVLYTPSAEIVHRRGRSIESAGADLKALYDRSHRLYYEKHLPRWARLLGWWQTR